MALNFFTAKEFTPISPMCREVYVLSACRAACAAADLTARRSGACAAVHPLRRAERTSPRQHGAP